MLSRLLLLCVVAGAVILSPVSARVQTLSDTEQVEFLLFEGGIHLEEGKILEAVAAFSQAVALDPERFEAHLLYALALTRGLLAGLFEDVEKVTATAITHYDWVLEKNPNHREALAGRQLLDDRHFSRTSSPMKTEEGKQAWIVGQEALRVGDTQAEQESFQKAVREEPDVAAARSALGEALRKNGRPKEAVKEFERALELDPENLSAYVGLGTIREKEGDAESAFAHFRRTLELNPDYQPGAKGTVRILEARGRDALKSEEWSLLGRSYLALQRYDEAVEALNKAMKDSPSFDTRKALGTAEFFRGEDERALASLTEAHDQVPQDLEVLYYMGAANLRLGKSEIGIGFLEQLLEMDPLNPGAQRLLGLSLADNPARTEDAVRYLLGADAAGAQIKSFSCILGTLYMRLRRSHDASRAFEDCLTQDPDFTGAYLGLGIIADDQGQTRDAIHYLGKYISLEEDPDRSAIFRLGVAYLRSGQDELGFDTLRGVVQTRSEDAERDSVTLTDTELLEATSFFLATVRRFSDAIFIGEMLLTRDPGNAIYNNNLAMSYADANLKPGRAHALALKANRLSPDNPGHLDTLGWVLIRLKQFDEAGEVLLRSIDMAGEEQRQGLSEMYYHLGFLYHQTQQLDKARKYLNMATENPPTLFLKSEIERLLQQVNSEAENR
jgi:tetratricopeptide (TPR) repeat protein